MITGQKSNVLVPKTKSLRWKSKSPGGIYFGLFQLLQSLNMSKTTHFLERGKNSYLYVDMKQMGVGGDIGWGPLVHPEYLLTAKKYEYSFLLKFR